MKRFITLILMLTTLLTFTQKATAFAPLLTSEKSSMVDCPMSTMSMEANEAQMDMSKTDCTGDEMSLSMDCQNGCDFMTVVSVLYFINHEQSVIQHQSKLPYQASRINSSHYFPESLYRPPFLN